MEFKVAKKAADSLARTGWLTTPHGRVKTPVFMPVGTAGIIKTLAPWEVAELGAEIILGNSYHLHVRPGEDLIAELGGLHQWSRWSRPILTDSGGYQAYSLGRSQNRLAKATNEGVKFRSHIDGRKLFFTPESVLDIQLKLGSDIAMVLDDCPPIEASEKRVRSAVIRTREWARQSIDYWQKTRAGERGQGMFGIIQGGLFAELRRQSLADIQSLPFDGLAIGGVAIASEGKEKINRAVEYLAADLDPERPHYLMGVGEPADLIRMIDKGMDMFDCVIPTRYARHGAFWSGPAFERWNIRASRFTRDSAPLDPSCECRICQQFSRSYLRHLFVSGESFALRALSYHNLNIVLRLIDKIRQSIEEGNFRQTFHAFLG